MTDRQHAIRTADRMWHLLVAHAFSHRCAMCGQPATDPHHWRFRRSVLAYRWTLENGVYLCRPHHQEVGLHPDILHERLRNAFPILLEWCRSQPPFKPQPISTAYIEGVVAELMLKADALGILYKKE